MKKNDPGEEEVKPGTMEFMISILGNLAMLFVVSVIIASVILVLILLIMILKKRKK